MKIVNNSVVRFHYRLRDDAGGELETSYDGEPSTYLHGYRGVVSGLEDAIAGRRKGDAFSVTLPPERAFGLRREGQQQRVPIKHLIGKAKPKVGMPVSLQTASGVRPATVLKVGRFNVDVDTNHPLSGKTVTFEVEIIEVRDATADEIAHGHAHGPGGHQH